MAPSKRTILITGCSDGGLGSALALAFHKAGWRVFASGRTTTKLALASAAGLEIVQLDTTSEASIAASVSLISSLTGGSLDALLNNAGAGYSMPLLDLDLSKVRELFDLNVFSLISMTRAYAPLLMKSTYGGMLINNTSVSSLPPGALSFAAAYNASKAAATSITENFRLELAPFGIKVVNLMTGGVKSNFFHNAPAASLPESSIYNVAKDTVEKAMSGAEMEKTGEDRAKWAGQVVHDVSKSSPPHWVWRGSYASQVRIASLLPIGMLDSQANSMVGLDVVERKLKEQRGVNSVKPL